MGKPLLIGCNHDEKNQCHVKHCHCCKTSMEDSCVCQECVLDARNGWLEHLHNHKRGHNPQPETCNLCALEIDGVGTK